MKILHVAGEMLTEKLVREAIIGTGKKPETVRMGPAQELATVIERTEFHKDSPLTLEEVRELSGTFLGMKITCDYKMPLDEAEFIAADGTLIARIVSLGIPK